MIADFTFYLTVAILVTGGVTIVNWLYGVKKRRVQGIIKPAVFIEYSRALLPVLLVVWIIRSFVIQPYRVPTGSLEPTVLPGDFIAAQPLTYGIRLPILDVMVVPTGKPQRGDIALFRWPKDPRLIFVKRIIGLPWDHLVYRHKTLYINGKEQKQILLSHTYDVDPIGYERIVDVREENLMGVRHAIYIQPRGGETHNYDLTVPAGHYFVMGDNRDNSEDSRQWGFVPEKNLIGRALGVWMSWDPIRHHIRWDRIGIGL
ncbi:MAG: signal peptidase I [Coxiella sp. RIFCSPHIGHO2_12_FULL_44_14]|nr:MAG: signal peptidase I [Coxiella sp. RIFCSPHIGHO2_12_FULL_44_14]